MVKVKRVYEPAKGADGFRVLVDRLWPRGLSKEQAKVDLWLRDVAPSDALRKWFAHDPAKWPEFQRRYRAELRDKVAPLQRLKQLERERRMVTLVYAASDTLRNNAVALAGLLNRNLRFQSIAVIRTLFVATYGSRGLPKRFYVRHHV